MSTTRVSWQPQASFEIGVVGQDLRDARHLEGPQARRQRADTAERPPDVMWGR
jgi:hypothetical protein